MSALLMAQTSVPRVAVVNFSTLLDPAFSYNFTKSLQLQVRRDFAPAWGVDSTVAAKLPADVQPYHWVLAILDNSTQADVLGFHDLTPAGKPIMKVYVADANNAGVPVSAVASHELLETLTDPFIEAVALFDNGENAGAIIAYEVCDPVQADTYQIFGNAVSNFVMPWWFGDAPPPGAKFDFLGKLSAPRTFDDGGFYSFRSITVGGGLGPWQDTATANGKAEQMKQAFAGRRLAHGGVRL